MKKFFLFVFTCLCFDCFAYFPEKGLRLFNPIDKDFMLPSKHGNPLITRIESRQDFDNRIKGSNKPFIVKIFYLRENAIVNFVFNKICDTFKDKVDFFSLDISRQENFVSVREFLAGVNVNQVVVPTFLLGVEGKPLPNLIDFPKVLSKQSLAKVIDDLIKQIRSKFRSRVSLSKIEEFGKKVQRWLAGLRKVSKKEIKFMQ